ncbi:radical SAM protein [Candidatus Woesearchaeota archaeon]|nr:radical SAM protein [Candidatus Woesearchaeota archaeon]
MSYQELPHVKGLDYATVTQVSDRTKGILDLQIGDRCNFKCLYCFTAAGNEVRGLAEQYQQRTGRIAHLLTSDEHIRILDMAYRRGINHLIISSEGENTLYEAPLFDVIEYARNYGFSIVLFTNGTRMHEAFARRLKQSQVSLIAKLNSLDPLKNSRISGSQGNGYRYAGLNGQLVPDYIHRLKDAGYTSEDFALNVVVHALNQDEVLEFWEWARNSSTGITPFAEFLEPTGFVKGHEELNITPEKMQALQREVRELDASLGHSYDALPSVARLFDMRFLINPHVVVIDSRGFVKNFAANFDVDSVYGNVRDLKLEEVLTAD